MQTERYCCATFSFDEKENSVEEYMQGKRILEESAAKMKKEEALNGPGGEMIISAVALDRKQILTACYYKDKLFIAIADKKGENLDFHSSGDTLALLKENTSERLVLRFKQDILNYNSTGKHLQFFPEKENPWEKNKQILDAITEYEKKVEKLPEAKREAFYKSGEYDKYFEKILEKNSKANLTKEKEEPNKSLDGINQRIENAKAIAMSQERSDTREKVLEKENER